MLVIAPPPDRQGMCFLRAASNRDQTPGMSSDLQAVAAAYRRVRETGAMDYPARVEATRVYRERHPEAGEEASYRVAQLIYEASRKGLLRRVGS